MRVAHRYFRGTLVSWETLFDKAAEFASTLAPERVITISHSSDHSDGIVTVWYWTDEELPDESG